MSDISMRLNRDMLVLSSPIDVQLERLGINTTRDAELTVLLEPEVLHEAYALDVATGAQCIVADTAFITPARLAHARMQDRAADLAKNAIDVLRPLNPQHVLAEIAPCGLPLDSSSKASLNEHRDQYTRAARLFTHDGLTDAIFLNGFVNITELKCALMGIRKISDMVVIASVDARVIDAGTGTTLESAGETMAEFGANVAGLSTPAPANTAAAQAAALATASSLPTLVQLEVARINPEQAAPTTENPYYDAETMVDAAETLREAGVQMLRASGNATPAYTGALVAATLGDSVLDAPITPQAYTPTTTDPDELARLLRARISAELGN